jgi:hypothetical protein
MINYPVSIEKVSGKNENFLLDASGKSLGIIYDIYPAHEIANALNAMNTIMTDHPELAKFDFDLDKWYTENEYQMNAD